MAEHPLTTDDDRLPIRILVGYEPSPRTAAVMSAAALLFPGASAWIAHVWTPPVDTSTLRRLAVESGSAAVLTHKMEAAGVARSTRIATSGATLASALGWRAEPVVRRGVADPGAELVRLAEELEPDVVLVGSRGMRGAEALLNSVSDLVVHRSDRPVLVVASPPAEDLFTLAASGPVLVGWDGTEGAVTALATAQRLFPDRDVVAVAAGSGDAPPPLPDPPATPSPAPDDGRRPELVAVPVHAPPLSHGRAVAHALAGYAIDRRAALLVVGSRRRSAVAEVVLGSVAVAALHHGAVPVLVVPPPKVVSAD